MELDLSDGPADDGLTIRSANPWALDKLDIVSCYVAGFVNACKRAGFSQVVDGFAGPGVNRIEGRLAWGTPMRVLQAQPPVDRLLANASARRFFSGPGNGRTGSADFLRPLRAGPRR